MSESQPEAPFVLPSQVAVHRYVQMKVESVWNTPYKITGNITPLEHCLGGTWGKPSGGPWGSSRLLLLYVISWEVKLPYAGH